MEKKLTREEIFNQIERARNVSQSLCCYAYEHDKTFTDYHTFFLGKKGKSVLEEVVYAGYTKSVGEEPKSTNDYFELSPEEFFDRIQELKEKGCTAFSPLDYDSVIVREIQRNIFYDKLDKLAPILEEELKARVEDLSIGKYYDEYSELYMTLILSEDFKKALMDITKQEVGKDDKLVLYFELDEFGDEDYPAYTDKDKVKVSMFIDKADGNSEKPYGSNYLLDQISNDVMELYNDKVRERYVKDKTLSILEKIDVENAVFSEIKINPPYNPRIYFDTGLYENTFETSEPIYIRFQITDDGIYRSLCTIQDYELEKYPINLLHDMLDKLEERAMDQYIVAKHYQTTLEHKWEESYISKKELENNDDKDDMER